MKEKSKQSIGGKKRAESLTSEQRSKIASMAAKSRWDDERSLQKAIYNGELNIGDAKIPCAVLEDGQRVLSETGITKAILGARSGASIKLKKNANSEGALLPTFIAPGQLKPFINSVLSSEPLKQIIYKDGRKKIVGYSAEILPIICDIWLRAREAGALQKQQLPKALKAEILMRGLAKVGVIALVDEATGYQYVRERCELNKILEAYISEELMQWTKKFPDEFYKQMFRLWGWEYPGYGHKGAPKGPRYAGKLTKQLIYEKLPNGIVDEIERKNPPNGKGQRKQRHHQWLTDNIGDPHLDKQVSIVTTLMRISDSKDDFLKSFEKAFPNKDQE